MDDAKLRSWFEDTVLPLEPQLLAFFRRRTRESGELRDLLHDVYERVLISARDQLPQHSPAFVFAVARNLLIDRARRDQVVSLEFYSEMDQFLPGQDWLTPDRQFSGRQELERALAGMDRLPVKCREIVRLRKIEGLSTREAAERLHVGTHTIERQLVLGMRALTDFMLGGEGRIRRDKPGIAAIRRKGPFRVWRS